MKNRRRFVPTARTVTARCTHDADTTPGPYLMIAIRRAMMRAALEQLAVVHLSREHRGEAFTHRRVELDADVLAHNRTPEVELRRARAAAGVRAWLEAQPERQREVATRLVGLGRPEQAPREAAAAMRLPARAVHDARHRLIERARADAGLRALWEEIAA